MPLKVRARAADALCDFAPDGLTRVFFVNSGAEANENALRLACQADRQQRASRQSSTASTAVPLLPVR